MNTREIAKAVNPIFQKHRVLYAGVFGSAARGENRPQSDVDFLVAFDVAPSLVGFIRMEKELEEALHTSVDVVVYGSEKRLIKPYIYKDLISLYGQRPAVS